jgi:nicotinamidase-related amidase
MIRVVLHRVRRAVALGFQRLFEQTKKRKKKMEIIRFNREKSALVLIDHQVGTMQLIKNIPSDSSLRNAVLLAKAAKTLDMPIVMTASMEDHPQGPLAAELKQVAPEAYDARVKRLGIVNAWADQNFKAAVEATGRKQLVMAGVTTDRRR